MFTYELLAANNFFYMTTESDSSGSNIGVLRVKKVGFSSSSKVTRTSQVFSPTEGSRFEFFKSQKPVFWRGARLQVMLFSPKNASIFWNRTRDLEKEPNDNYFYGPLRDFYLHDV